MKKNLVVGLTGGIASGKTTIAEIFQNLGADIIDADLLYHHLLRDDPSIKNSLAVTFGEHILNENGEIDRSKLGPIVFDNPDRLRTLNELVHPSVIRRMRDEIERRLTSAEHKVVMIVVPLLIETNMTGMVDTVVLVYADEEIQLRRLIQRGLSQEDAQKRIRSQMSSREKARFADFIINNNGLLSDTTKQVKQVWKSLMDMMFTGAL
jgi:dephospho-CoA kinase